MDTIKSQLESTLTVLENSMTVIPEDLSSWGYPSTTKAEIVPSFKSVISLIEKINEQKENEYTSMLKISLTNNLKNLNAQVQALPGNPQPNFNNLMTNLTTLFSILTNHYLLRPKNERKGISGALLKEISQAKSIIDSAIKSGEKFNEFFSKSLDLSNKIKNFKEESKNGNEKIQNFLDEVVENAGEAETHLSNIKVDSENAKKFNESIESIRANNRDLNDKLEKIISDSKKQQEIIQQNIEDSNRSGMAGSFNKRKSDLSKTLGYFAFGLIFSLISILAISIKLIVPEISKGVLGFSQRIPLTFPFIFLAWWCTKNFSLYRSVKEDYAFKNASAMAFEGYKKEAQEISPELSKKLLDSAIKNFTDNPTRLIEKHSHHGSPTSEILESAFKILDKYGIEIIRKVNSK